MQSSKQQQQQQQQQPDCETGTFPIERRGALPRATRLHAPSSGLATRPRFPYLGSMTAEAGAPAHPPITRTQVAAAVMGNALEFYDFTTYTIFAVDIGKAF